MRYFGLGLSLFIVAAVLTVTHFYLNTPDELHAQFVSSDPIVDEAAKLEAAFAKQILSALNGGEAGTLATPHSKLIKATNVNNITSQSKTYYAK